MNDEDGVLQSIIVMSLGLSGCGALFRADGNHYMSQAVCAYTSGGSLPTLSAITSAFFSYLGLTSTSAISTLFGATGKLVCCSVRHWSWITMESWVSVTAKI